MDERLKTEYVVLCVLCVLACTVRFEDKFSSSHIRIAKLLFLLLLFTHWNGTYCAGFENEKHEAIRVRLVSSRQKLV